MTTFIAAGALEYPGDGIHYFEGRPFTGIATRTHNGFEKSQIEYKDGLRSGRTTEWYARKVPMIDSTYILGVLHGRSREWHKNGQLAEDGEYEYGVVLWAKEWTSNGALVSDYTLDESGPQFELLMSMRKRFARE